MHRLDLRLYVGFHRGDQETFKELFDMHADKALRVARVILKDDGLAADAVQEAFLRAYIYRTKFNQNQSFELWFKRIVVNECLRIMSNQKQKPVYLTGDDRTLEAGESDVYGFEKYELLYHAIELLPDYQRVPVVLKYVDDLKESEIADIMGLKKSTVKSRLYDARQKLKSTLNQKGFGGDADA